MDQQNQSSAILITGAAGGLGSALVNASFSLQEIDFIIATDLNDEIPKQFKGLESILYYRMDIRSEKSIRRVKKELGQKGIVVKYLVNNAGVNHFFPITESTEKLLDTILKVNLYGPILTVSIFLDHLAKIKGRVVQISSDSIRLPIPFHPYPSSKIALEAFSIPMRRELELIGCKLVLVRPGAIQTSLTANMKTMYNEVDKSRYYRWFNNFSRLARKNIGKQSAPEKVAQIVLKIINTNNPRHVYSINKNRKVSFLSLLPGKMRDRLILKSLG